MALSSSRPRQAERADDDHLMDSGLQIAGHGACGMRSLVRAISAMWSQSAEIATNYNRVLLPLPCF